MGGKKKSKEERFLSTTKKVLYITLIVCLIDLQLTYILAFMDKTQVVESLSSTIATTIVVTLIGYFAKAFFETFAEKREERINKMISDEETEVEE